MVIRLRIIVVYAKIDGITFNSETVMKEEDMTY